MLSSRFEKIRKVLINNIKIIENFSYLSLLQIFNIILPLITYPYLIKIFGAKEYGKIIMAQTVVAYFSIIIEFGFNVSATNSIAKNINKKSIISNIVSHVYAVKIILTILSFALFFTTISIFPYFKEDKSLYLISFLVCFNELLFPRWYFQGIEKMKYITFINLGTRLIFVLLIFVFVKSRGDILLIPTFYGIGAILSGAIAIYILIKSERIIFGRIKVTSLISTFNESWALFLSSGLVLIRERTNTLILGIFVGMNEVTQYDFSLKIVNLTKHPFIIFRDAIFPKFAQTRSIQSIKKVLNGTLIISVFVYLILVLMAEFFVNFFGKEELKGAEKLFFYTGSYVIFTCITMFSGMGLIIFNYIKTYKNSLAVSLLIFIILIIIFISFKKISLLSIMIIYIISILIEAVIRFRKINEIH